MSDFTVYITWHVTDPLYWKYFEVPGIVFPLKGIFQLRKRSLSSYMGVLSRGFKRYYDFHGKLLVDSLLNPLGKQSIRDIDIHKQSSMLYLQYLLGADILVQKDIPLIGFLDNLLVEKIINKNLLLAENALRFGEKLGVDVMLVIHGWDRDSYLRSAARYKELGARYFGVGSLLNKINNRSTIRSVIRMLREFLGKDVYIHVFGVAGYTLLKGLAKYVNSADSSTPIKAAINKELIMIIDDKFLRIKLWNEELLRKMLIYCAEPVPAIVEGVLNASNYTKFKKALAVLNTYMFISYYKGENPCRPIEVEV